MINLLKFEFHKLFRQKSFYICTAVMVAMSFIGILISKVLAEDATQISGAYFLLGAISNADFTIICGIFIALFTCTDYSWQTIKNVYSRGYSRSFVYFAKFIVCIAATCAMFVVTILFNYAAGSIFFHGTAESGNYAGLLAGQLLFCIAYTSFVFAVSLSTKKSGLSIAIAILGPLVVELLLTFADSLIKSKTFKIADYWFNSFAYDLTDLAISGTRLWVCIALSIAYGAAFIAAGYLINRKQD